MESKLKHTEKKSRDNNHLLMEALNQLDTAQSQLIQQERLRALGQMAGGIAHDFNNSLTSILGYAELINNMPDLKNEAKIRKYLKWIMEAGNDAKTIVERFKEFYSQGKGKQHFTSVDLNHIIKETIKLTRPKWKDQAQGKGATIKFDSDLGSIKPIFGNVAELRNALSNLVMNAVDAMPEGGNILINSYFENKKVFLCIKDNGIGMSEEVLQDCMNPFMTTKGKKGTGLGLAMIERIIRRHSGDIQIKSSPGKGTTVTIAFPEYYPSEVNKPEKKKTSRKKSKSLKILLVDDELSIRVLINEFLTMKGHQIESASNGVKALELFRKMDFDVVITDNAMPDMNGDQLVTEICSIKKDIPIIMITGFGSLPEEFNSNDKIDKVIGKPVVLEDLNEGIMNCV